jgi:hypothetical protein
MPFDNRYTALDPAAVQALAKLHGVRADGDKSALIEALEKQDEEMGFKDGHTTTVMSPTSTSQHVGEGEEVSKKKKRRRGKKGRAKGRKKGGAGFHNDTVGATSTAGHGKDVEAPTRMEEIQVPALTIVRDKELAATEPVLSKAPVASMDTVGRANGGMITIYPYAAAMAVAVFVGMSCGVSAGLVWGVA